MIVLKDIRFILHDKLVKLNDPVDVPNDVIAHCSFKIKSDDGRGVFSAEVMGSSIMGMPHNEDTTVYSGFYVMEVTHKKGPLWIVEHPNIMVQDGPDDSGEAYKYYFSEEDEDRDQIDMQIVEALKKYMDSHE